MKFYSSADKSGLVDDVYFLIFGNSNDHTAELPLADVTRLINRMYDEVVTKILQADSQWNWDDNNKTDLPIGDIDLVSGQQNYGISGATYLKVGKIDCQAANGNWIRLRQFQPDELADRADKAFLNTPSTPSFYRIQANSLFLYPTPNYSLAKGLRVFYQRNVDYFAATDTTKVPGFAEIFHRILSIGAAADYCMTAGMGTRLATLNTKLTQMFTDLEIFYSTRNDNKVSMKLHKTDYGEIGLGQLGYSKGLYNEKGFW